MRNKARRPRQVHLALLRGAEGRGLATDGAPPPRAFQLAAAVPGGGGGGGVGAAAAARAPAATAWLQRISRVVLGAPLGVVGADAREAAAALAYGEYGDLGVAARVALLRALAALALEAEPVREHLAARVDALAAPRARRPPVRPRPDPRLCHVVTARARACLLWARAGRAPPLALRAEPALGGLCGRRPRAAAGERPGRGARQKAERGAGGEAGAAAEWERWMDACRVGVRRPLGADALRRRYWALGGRAGAFRVYVEEDEGRAWGWYEGARPRAAPASWWPRAPRTPNGLPPPAAPGCGAAAARRPPLCATLRTHDRGPAA